MTGFRSIRSRVAPLTRTLVSRNVVSLKSAYRMPLRASPFERSRVFQYQAVKNYSVLSSAPPAKEYKYEDVKEIVKNPAQHPDTILVDVREPVEYKDGHIPGAINIPFKSSPGALDLSEEDFFDNFGFDKPPHDKELVFYCLGGVRSTAAEDLANTFGYTKRGNYIGSWEDWASRENTA